MHALLQLASFSLIAVTILPVFAQHDVHAGRHPVGRTRRGLSRLEGRAGLEKRFDNAKFTFYDAGQNACGSVDKDSDLIVASNSDQYGSGSHCYQHITITANGKTAQPTITDECMGCPYAGLDLSRGLFDYFAPESEGVIYGSWNFLSDKASSSKRSPSPSSTPSLPPPSSSTS